LDCQMQIVIINPFNICSLGNIRGRVCKYY
jgi:hypothetical protein